MPEGDNLLISEMNKILKQYVYKMNFPYEIIRPHNKNLARMTNRSVPLLFSLRLVFCVHRQPEMF